LGNLIFSIFYTLSIVFFGLSAHAADVNLLKNPNFESRTSSWSKTGSSTFVIETAAPLEGVYSANWDASATGEFFRSSSYTVPDGLKGRRCAIQMEYLWSSGVSGDILMNVDDGTNNVATFTVQPTSGSVSGKATQNFECPTSGTIRFELESTANAASIRVDKMILGDPSNLAQISQATLVGYAYYDAVASCNWTRTNTAQGAFSTAASCNAPIIGENVGPGVIQTTDADLPQITVNNLPAGKYVVIANGQHSLSVSGFSSLALHDGTSESGRVGTENGTASGHYTIQGIFNYTSPGNRTFAIQGSSTPGTLTLQNGTGNIRTNFYIYKYPTSALEALTVETTGWFVRADIGGGTPSLSASVSSPAPVENSTLDLVNSGTINAQISCASTEEASGLTCSGNEQVGAAFVVPYAGLTEVCFEFPVASNTGAAVGALQDHTFRVIRTANTSQTALETGIMSGYNRHQGANGSPNGSGSNVRACGTFNLSAGKQTFRVNYTASSSTGAGGTVIIARAAGSAYQSNATFTARPVNQQVPAPIFTALQNNVKSGENGWLLMSADVATTGTVSGESGEWITGNCTNASPMVCTVTGFTSSPHCWTNVDEVGSTTNCQTSATSSTSVSIKCNNDAGAATTTSVAKELFCHGK
jgi:hypothetical protein